MEARLSLDLQTLSQFAPCAHVTRALPAAEQEELHALARRGAELDPQAQALDDAPRSPDEAELIGVEAQDIEARRKAIHEARKTWAPGAKTHAGAIVTISREDDVEVVRGLVRETDC